MAKKISFAVVGYGFIGRKHAELVGLNPESELIAIVEPDPENSALAKKNHPNTPLFSNLASFFASETKTDFINICTPNYLHIAHSKECLAYGSNVICEKPLGINLASAQELKKISLENKKEVFCVLQNRYSPPIKWLKEVVNNGSIGKVSHVQINCYWNRDDRYYFPNGKKHAWKGIKSKDGGVLYTQFSHFVDILTWVFGEVSNVNHRSSNFKHLNKTDFDDTGSIVFDIKDGGIGNFNYSTAVWDKNLESSLTVIGEKGSLKIGGQYMDQVVHCHIQDYEMPTLEDSQPANDYGHYKGSAQNHKFVIQNAIDFILKDAKIDVSLDEGLASIENIERLAKFH